MRKPLLLFLAIVVFAFYSYGFYQWIQSGHSFKDVLQVATSDWILLITVVDMGVFTLLCLTWLYRDMNRRHISGGKKFWIFFGTIIFGAVGLLVYLALRKETDLKHA